MKGTEQGKLEWQERISLTFPVSLISNLLYLELPQILHVKEYMLYHSIYMKCQNRQKQSMVIKIGNINQPFRSRVEMTGKEHKRTSGVKKVFSILTVCWLHSVLSNVFIKTLQTVHLR